MLLQFSVSNLLSFDDETVFSMLADPSDKSHPGHLIPHATPGNRKAVRASVIYGPNGAGKSNLIHAISLMKTLVTKGTRPNRRIPVRAFRLRADSEERPTKFDIVFRIEDETYNYGFLCTSTTIQEEWLFVRGIGKERALFVRQTDADGKTLVDAGPQLTGRSPRKAQLIDFIAEGTRPNQLFLTEAIERNVAEIRKPYDWFEDTLLIISPEMKADVVELSAFFDPQFAGFMGILLQEAGTGISGIKTVEIPFDFDRYVPDMQEVDRQKLLANLETLSDREYFSLEGNTGRLLIRKGNNGQPVLTRLDMLHKSIENHDVIFRVEEESDGTQRLIDLAPALSMLMDDVPKVILIDELDRRLHTHVSRYILETFLNSKDNSGNQLIVTTHDTNLQDLELLRRDEIWFAEKNEYGATRLYSLAEFKVRPDLRIERSYLNGRFGAIPRRISPASMDAVTSSAA